MRKRGFPLLHDGYEMHGLPSHFHALSDVHHPSRSSDFETCIE